MRSSIRRWFAPLLRHPESTAFLVHQLFPSASFRLEKKELENGKMIRHITFTLSKRIILRARSEVDLGQTNPKLVHLLRTTDQPLGFLINSFHVRRTRVRATTRTREYHFSGDLHAKVMERFYLLPAEESYSTKPK